MTNICSVWAYHEILESGKLARLHGMYLAVFSEASKPLTMNQSIERFKIKFKDLPYKTNHGMGSRISELTDMGFLEKFDMVKCEHTLKTVNRWVYTGRKQPKEKIYEFVCCPRCNGLGKLTKAIYKD